MTKRTFILFVILLIAAVFGYFWLEWRSLQNFVTAIDHGDILFGDLVDFYHPMTKVILTEKLPVNGYYYSAFFALLISPLGSLPIEQAQWIWGALQVVLAGLLAWVAGFKTLELPRPQKLLFLFLFLTSFPLLHNFKWGQISVLMTLCILASMWLYQQDRPLLSALILAFAVSIKYYPIIFLAYPLFKRDFRFLSAFGISALIFYAVIPSLVLGPQAWVGFERAVSQLITDAKFTGDVNSQYLGHVILRSLPFDDAPFKQKVASMLLQSAGGLVFLANIGLIWLAQKKQVKDALVISTGLMFLSLPFIIQTSWSHYFVYLPFVQITLIHFFGKESKPALGFLVASCAASSILVFNLFPGWSAYNNAGMLFISNLLLLIAIYLWLWRGIKKSADD